MEYSRISKVDSQSASFVLSVLGRLKGAKTFDEIKKLKQTLPLSKLGILSYEDDSRLIFGGYDKSGHSGVTHQSLLVEKLDDKTRSIFTEVLFTGDVVEEIRGWKGNQKSSQEYYIYKVNDKVLSRRYKKDAQKLVGVTEDGLENLLN